MLIKEELGISKVTKKRQKLIFLRYQEICTFLQKKNLKGANKPKLWAHLLYLHAKSTFIFAIWKVNINN